MARRNVSHLWINWGGNAAAQADATWVANTIMDISVDGRYENAKIVRLIGELTVRSDYTGNRVGPDCSYYGVCMVSEAAVGVGGATAVPKPGTDFDVGWLVHHGFGIIHDTAKTTPGTFIRKEFDVSSNRRLKKGFDLVGIMGNQSGDGFSWDLHGRILLELP